MIVLAARGEGPKLACVLMGRLGSRGGGGGVEGTRDPCRRGPSDVDGRPEVGSEPIVNVCGEDGESAVAVRGLLGISDITSYLCRVPSTG